MTVHLVNPLPHAMAHYLAELRHVLPGPCTLVEPSVEREDGSLLLRLARQAGARRVPHDDGPVLVLWPALGRFDPVTWAAASRRRPVSVVVHDPLPLRHQRGHGHGAGIAEHAARAAGVGVIAHSSVAYEVLAEQGWEPQLLPHPVLPASVAPRHRDGVVLVLGQHKPTRLLAPLHELAGVRALDGRRLVRGRGWPDVAGWEVQEGFLSETDFELSLRTARCLVLPYDRYYQSGVAVRALEAGVPVVARRHPFLTDLLGADWVGFTGAGGWADAVARVDALPDEELVDLALAAEERAQRAWSQSGL